MTSNYAQRSVSNFLVHLFIHVLRRVNDRPPVNRGLSHRFPLSPAGINGRAREEEEALEILVSSGNLAASSDVNMDFNISSVISAADSQNEICRCLRIHLYVIAGLCLTLNVNVNLWIGHRRPDERLQGGVRFNTLLHYSQHSYRLNGSAEFVGGQFYFLNSFLQRITFQDADVWRPLGVIYRFDQNMHVLTMQRDRLDHIFVLDNLQEFTGFPI